MNKIASDVGDLVCVGVNVLDVRVLSSHCTVRSSTITIGYLAMAVIAAVVVALLVRSRRTT